MTNIAFGKYYLPIKLDKSNILGVIEPKDDFKCIKKFNTPKDLKKIIRNRKKVLIVVPDNTRRCHLETILVPLLQTMDEENCSTQIIIATGLHKKPNKSQLKEMFGEKILLNYPIFCHEQKSNQIANLGKTKSGVPITLNKMLLQHDVILTIGVVEPHLYAGFSGGPKTIAIGLAGEKTINATHNLKFLDHKGTKLCATRTNPFHRTLWEIISPIKVDYAINIVNNSKGELIRIFSGSLKYAYNHATNFVANNYILLVKEPSNLLICGLGSPKDTNIYQASRVINYLLDVENPIVKKGGVIIIAAELAEGIGKGLGEIRFYQDLIQMINIKQYLKKVRKLDFIAGGHRTFMATKHLYDYKIIFVSKKVDLFTNTPFVCFSSIEEAINYARSKLGQDMLAYIYPKTLNSIAEVIK